LIVCGDSNTGVHLAAKGKRDLIKERFWRKVLERFVASGKSRNKFCAEEGLSTDLFVYWSKVIPERDAEAAASEEAAVVETVPEVFVPIAVADNSNEQIGGQRRAVAEIVFAGGSIFLFNGVDSTVLTSLFMALREAAQ
jgi:hypothetical protein